ncbi:replication protein P [Serratia rubidaea]|uniref:replication protein P n=1 Tax=Serratia rubidaea TaxID=61652 RepID=UPI002432AEA2|nr:replication protein P [Serratia rubidaea]MCR0998681.1 replication protein P [Serratia rubidaea]
MMEIYSDRWTAKNGRAPSLLWKQAITALTDKQIQQAIAACVQRCWDGNSYAPDLADFMSIVSHSSANAFGITAEDVMDEFRKYNRDRCLHSCPETYPWKQDVLYWIVCDLRREMIQKNLSEIELERRASKHLKRWAEKIQAGGTVPKPVPLLSEKASNARRGTPGAGHSAAMEMLARLRGCKPNTN